VHIRAPLFQTRSMDMNMRLSELGWVLPSGSPIYKNESWERATMCALFRLPDVLAILLLVDWLTIRSVVQLDSACCCRTSRTQLYCLFNSQFTTFTVNPFRQKRNCSLLRWVSTRNAKVDGLYLLTGFSASGQPLQKSLAPSGSTVRWVVSFAEGRVNCSVRQQTLLEIAQRCPDIHTAVVRCDEVEDWGECLVVSTKTLTRLTCLSLTGVTVSRAQLATILSHCTQLQSLNVRSDDAVIPVEVALPTLKSLMAYSNSLSDEVLIAIGQRCAGLETLHMFKLSRWNADTHGVTDVGVRAVLQGCPLLRDTDVEKAKDISPELRLEMARRRCCTDLKFYQWEGVTEVLTRDILRVCPNLTHLNCKTCDGFTDAALAVCAQHCPLLESIILEDCAFVTNDGVRNLLSQSGNKLRYVHLGSCDKLSDDAVLAVAQHCPNLELLVCPRLTLDATVVRMASACPRLMRVHLSYTKVGDAGLTALATHCLDLQEVYLYCCRRVTVQGVCALAAHCRHLTKLALPTQLSRLGLLPQLKWNSPCKVVYG
jgi:hypothetical protein